MTFANVNIRDIRRGFSNEGFRKDRTKGGHEIWTDGKRTFAIPIANLKPVIAQKLIKQANLSI